MIALGTARGLLYLHEQCDPKIIHRDVKASNVLLDEYFEAIVGDFGLAKLLDHQETHVTTAVRGTVGHIAPEYLSTGQSSEKTDVFGFGVLLVELITGQKALDFGRLANQKGGVLDLVSMLYHVLSVQWSQVHFIALCENIAFSFPFEFLRFSPLVQSLQSFSTTMYVPFIGPYLPFTLSTLEMLKHIFIVKSRSCKNDAIPICSYGLHFC